MTKYRLLFIFALSLSAYLVSCSKSTERPAASFTWSWNDSIPGTAKSHKAFPTGFGSPTIIATNDTIYHDSTAAVVIKLSSFNVGIYQITATGSNTLKYSDADTSYTANAGSVNITTYYGDAMAGDFSVMLTDTLGIPRSLKGRFRSTPINK
jgi:hypothetical protein